MTGTGRGAAAVWAVVLVGAALAVGIGASPARARAIGGQCFPPLCGTSTSSTTSSTSSSTSSTTSTTTSSTTVTTTTAASSPPTSPTTSPPSPYLAGFVPCGTGSGPCNATPEQVQVRYPAGTPPAAVEIDWVASGRAASAPAPRSTSATLAWPGGADCGSDLRCWHWPAGLTDGAFILNGTYRVVPCASYSGGTCGSTFPPSDVALAVPSGPPTHVQARSSGSQVTLSWQPPSAVPPDLAGYQVTRNGRAVYSCSIAGLDAGTSVPCPGSLTVIDHPGPGTYTYAVSAVRLGAGTASSHVVASAALEDAGGVVAVPGSAVTPGSGGWGGGFTPSPVIGSIGIISDAGGSHLAVDPGGLGAQPDPGPATPQNLAYPPDNSAVANPSQGKSSTLALKVGETAPRTDVVPIAVVALGILMLAIAAHFLYLRMQLGVIEAGRRSERARHVQTPSG
jgi:hypothetical protein